MNALMLSNVQQPIKLRVSDYFMLDAAGVYSDWRKTELIDGEVVGMTAQHRPHSFAKTQLAFRLQRALAELRPDLTVLIEATVEMGANNAPEPDLTVTSDPIGDGPIPLASVALIVEVSDSTLGFDMQDKALIYARHAVPEYWVVDLNAARIARMWTPKPAGFGNADQTAFGNDLTSATIPGLSVQTDALT